MKLINQETRAEIKPGDKLDSFRGETWIVSDPVGHPPKHEGSSGGIYVKQEGEDMSMHYYPSVFGCKWEEE